MSGSPQTSPRKLRAGPPSDRKCCGVISESVRESRKRTRRPQPWIIRKMWILVTLGIMGYSAYAFLARLCLPMITRKWWALGSQTTGILLVVFFGILYLWLIWAYFTVVLTSPGYAKDHVEKCERPPLSDLSASPYYSHSGRYGAQPISEATKSEGQKPSLSEKTSQTYASTHPQDGDSAAGPSYEHMVRSDSTSWQAKEPSPGIIDTIAQPSLSTVGEPNESGTPISRQHQTVTPAPQSRRDIRRARKLSEEAATNKRLEELNVFRKPSLTPILQPVFRYCDTDEFIKPYRAHHCRACGTCVLRYDHHCPWIGQCVGARNHKFFLNFCLSTSIFTAYVLATVLFFIVKSVNTRAGYNLDPHFLILFALAVLFWLFTTGLSVSHVKLITHGQTTVESMHIKGMQEKEDQTLSRAFKCWEYKAKRHRKRFFDEEWGSMNTEGNLWWRGSSYTEWTDVMGKNWLGWIFPIGSGLSDGLLYPINPRFDSDGRLRKRSQWPEDLR